jgi:cell division protein FtsZ
MIMNYIEIIEDTMPLLSRNSTPAASIVNINLNQTEKSIEPTIVSPIPAYTLPINNIPIETILNRPTISNSIVNVPPSQSSQSFNVIDTINTDTKINNTAVASEKINFAQTPPVPLASSNIAMSAQGEVLLNATKPPVNIKVVGVGGGGGNAVTHMIRSGVKNATYITVNTDSQALYKTPADIKIQLGDNGQGAGAKPDIARKYAEAARTQLKEALQGADMVFITAGLGKGTGTGASAVVAQVAQELNALTVCVVTKPFASEGAGRAKLADAAADELEIHSDAIIVVLNSKLEDRNPDGLLREWYQAADDVLKNAVATIIEVIQTNGYQNVDFRDVASVIGSNRGRALMGTARASGPNRAKDAAIAVLNCDLLEEENLRTARGVLINITAAESSMRGRETNEVINTILASFADDVTPIHGITFDDNMGDEMQVTLIVSGIGARAKAVVSTPTPVSYPGRSDFGVNTQIVSNFSHLSSASLHPITPTHPTALLKTGTDHVMFNPLTEVQADRKPINESVSVSHLHLRAAELSHLHTTNNINNINNINNANNTNYTAAKQADFSNSIPTLTQEIEITAAQRVPAVNSPAASVESTHVMFNPSLMVNPKQDSQKIVTAMQASGVPNIEIPTYLRNQQDIETPTFLRNQVN